MNVCLIPARGGSKRIPKKNIRNFHGKPMIAWSIESAQKSRCFDRIIVSTDDIEIAEIARTFGADVPFLRPAYLSDDHTGTLPVVKHALQYLDSSSLSCTSLCCLYATAPFAQYTDISKGLSLLEECDLNSFVYTATEFGAPIERALRIDQESGKSFMLNPQKFTMRSQDCERYTTMQVNFIGVVTMHGLIIAIYLKALYHLYCLVGVFRILIQRMIGYVQNCSKDYLL